MLHYVLIGVSIPFAYIWAGYVLSVLWAWFVSPIFSVAGLSVMQAVGVIAVASLLTRGHLPSQMKPTFKDEDIRDLLFCFAQPGLCLLVGWIVHQFM